DANIAVLVVTGHRYQAMVHQALQDRIKTRRRLALGAKRIARLLAPGVGAAFAKIDQAKQDPERDRLLLRRQPAEHEVGVLLDGERQARPRASAQCMVVGEREQAVAALAPELEQRLLQERKRAGLPSRFIK